MTSVLLWRIVAGLLVFIVAVGYLLAEMVRREDEVRERIRLVQGLGRAGPTVRVDRLEDGLAAIRRLGGLIIQSGILPRKSITDLEQTLAAAGYRPATALPLVVGNKVALMVMLPVIGWLMAGSTGIDHGYALRWIAAGLGASIGMMLPDMVAGWLRRGYLSEVERGLPDALDLLVICADAGLPLETALERVALEFRESDPPTANELSLTASEMKILPDRRLALVNLGARTGLESLIALGGTLAQTLQYGTPLTQALRTLSAEMRTTMLVRFEERAARLPVLLTLPMIGLFLPCVIIIVLAPAGVQVYHMMNG
jgi:tight adherence protein C